MKKLILIIFAAALLASCGATTEDAKPVIQPEKTFFEKVLGK
jgi:hypothetical protein